VRNHGATPAMKNPARGGRGRVEVGVGSPTGGCRTGVVGDLRGSGTLIKSGRDPMHQWQPIDTAPDDMRIVLLFVPGRRIGDFQEEGDEIRLGFRKRGGWHSWPEDHTYIDGATHWMPLPENPPEYRHNK
jgi:hypothetical protein